MDTFIEAASMAGERLEGRSLSVAIAGAGRDRRRLERLAAHARVPVKFLGKVADADLPDLYACSDVFALCCRSRWWGLEQEGFGVVLVEAAASGVPCITLDSGGAGEAVVNGQTGLVLADDGARPEGERAAQVADVAGALVTILSDPVRGRRMGEAGRRRAEEELRTTLSPSDWPPLSTGCRRCRPNRAPPTGNLPRPARVGVGGASCARPAPEALCATGRPLARKVLA